MTYATTFSGIGGWELGLNACGWELQWQCECDPFCRTLLAERFGVPIYEDIRTICEQEPKPVDALIGSPPCQPFSVAGKKRGVSDERHLYPAFLALVRHLAPRWVLMEQVPAILSLDGGRAFGGYLAGLAALGFDLVWHCIPASATGAPHRRDRIWIIAHAQHNGPLAGTVGRGISASEDKGRLLKPEGFCQEDVADSDHQGPQGWHSQELSECATKRIARPSGSPLAHAISQQPSRRDNGAKRGKRRTREAAFYGRSGGILEDGWWATEPNVGRVANGIPFRVDRLKGLGNAVVPKIPYLIGQAINEV